MYKKTKLTRTSMTRNEGTQGETLEQKIERIVNNNEPIKDGAPIIHTERQAGVVAGYNPRTDRWDIAIDAQTTVAKTHQAKRAERIELAKEAAGKKAEKEIGKAEPTQGTNE